MSRNSRIFHCSPRDVWDVLADGWSYSMWVVGAVRIRDVDHSWPAPGSTIHHSVGVWPLLLNDTTAVDAASEPDLIVLTVRAWPTGQGRVQVTCAAEGPLTRVTMEEDATSGPARLIPKPLRDLLLSWRNEEALRRLAYLAESRARRADDTGGDGAVARVRPPARTEPAPAQPR